MNQEPTDLLIAGCFNGLFRPPADDNIYDRSDRWQEVGIKPSSKVATNLHEERDRAFLFRRILRLATNAELPYPRDTTKVGRPQEAEIRTQLKRLGLLESLGNVLLDRGNA